MDINQNVAHCLQNTNNFGSTVVHNICNGTTQVVPWGGLDWVICLGLTGFGLAITALLAAVAWNIATE